MIVRDLVLAGFGLALVVALLAALRESGLVCTVASAGAVVARVFLVSRGYVFKSGQVRLLDVILAAVLLILLAYVTFDTLGEATSEQRTAVLAALLALPVAAYAFLQLLVPAGRHSRACLPATVHLSQEVRFRPRHPSTASMHGPGRGRRSRLSGGLTLAA